MCEDAKKEMEQLIREVRTMLEEDADIKRLFIRKTGAGPQVEIAGVGKVSLEEAEKLVGKDVRWSRGGSGRNNSWYNEDGSISYPPNNGAVPGTEKIISLKPGKILGRYGYIGDKSNFVTQTGADASKLSLPPNTDPSIYQEFIVIKEIPNIVQAEIAAWGNSLGGGMQYELPMPIKQLIKEGYIVPK